MQLSAVQSKCIGNSSFKLSRTYITIVIVSWRHPWFMWITRIWDAKLSSLVSFRPKRSTYRSYTRSSCFVTWLSYVDYIVIRNRYNVIVVTRQKLSFEYIYKTDIVVYYIVLGKHYFYYVFQRCWRARVLGVSNFFLLNPPAIRIGIIRTKLSSANVYALLFLYHPCGGVATITHSLHMTSSSSAWTGDVPIVLRVESL